MEYRLLGPLDVIDDDGVSIDIGSRQQRALLAMLLLSLNRVVSTERILEEFWPDDPSGKEKTLWVYISRLRSALEPNREAHAKSEVLVTRDHGYSLRVDPSQVDAYQFESEVEAARTAMLDDPAAACDRLTEALRLWTGEPLEDFVYHEFAQADVMRLQEARLVAVEDRIECDLRLGRHREVVADLEGLVREQPLRERPVRLQMLALYRSGRQADALRAFERYRKTIGGELGIEPSPELLRVEEQVLLHDGRLVPASIRSDTGPVDATSAENPFKGLQPFSESDVTTFFGRDRMVSDLVRRISAGSRLIALVGASGSGKSSVIKAGLIPTLRKGGVAGSDQWLIAQMVPGARPFAEAEASLLRSTFDPPDSLGELLDDPEDGLLRACLRVLPDESSRIVLVIDQFEELFTLVPAEDERARFIRNLEVVLNDPHKRVIVVIALRADFYAKPLEYPRFAQQLGEGIVNTGPLTPDELEAAAEQPAAHVGVQLEPALVVSLLTDVAGQAGGLPLFQYALTELFDRRSGSLLTSSAYEEMGGVKGALTRRAEDLFLDFDEEKRTIVRQLFLRLVTITGDRSWGRRRVSAWEIVNIVGDVVALQEVLDRFRSHRLLTSDRDVVTGSPTVEVAHEALLQEWPRLRDWIEEGKDDVLRHGRLTTALAEWKASGEKADYLLSGERLKDYEDWASVSTLLLSSEEDRYLDQSILHREAERMAEEERSAREEMLDRQARSRARSLWIVGGIVATAVVAALVLFFASRQPEIVLVHGPTGDGGIADLMLDGASEVGLSRDIEIRKVGLLVDREQTLIELADAGADLIIVSSEFDAFVERVAPDYPDVHWVAIDPTALHIKEDNISEIHFAVQDSAFLAGAAAALSTDSGSVGFIGGMQLFPSEASRTGFEQGVAWINRVFETDVEAVSTYVGPVPDPLAGANTRPDLARELAAQMYSDGVDVIFHDAGESGAGVAEAARDLSTPEHRLWVIGSDADEYEIVSGVEQSHVLSSAVKRFDIAVKRAVEAYLDGDLEPGDWTLDLEDDGIRLSRSGGFLSQVDGHLRQIEDEVMFGHLSVSPFARTSAGWQLDAAATVHLTLYRDSCVVDSVSGAQLSADELTLARGDVVFFELTNQSGEVGGVSLRTIPSGKTIRDIEEEALTGIPKSFEDVLGVTLVEAGATTSTAAVVAGESIVPNCLLFETDILPADFPALIVRTSA